MFWAILSSGIGAILLMAGIPKVRDHERMTRVVRGYRMVPDATASSIGRTLPWVEIALGAALVTGVAPRLAGAAAAALFTVFFVGLTVNLARGRRELDCGCFAFGAGTEETQHIGWWHSVRAAVLVVAGVVVAATPDLTAFDRLAGAGVGLLAVAVAGVGLYARSVMSLGRRPIDDYLTNAAIEMRAVSSTSRY